MNGFRKEGEFYYSHVRRRWGVYRAGKVINGTQSCERVADFATRSEASAFTYRMNHPN